VIACLALYLGGCEPLKGRIIGKAYVPSSTYPITTFMQVGSVMIPITTIATDPEKFLLRVQTKDGFIGYRTVTLNQFREYEVGDTIE